MFERYTESARRVIFFARYEAHQSGASEIGPEHFLLGFLRQTNFFGEEASKSIRDEIEQGLRREETVSKSVEMPFALATKRVLAYGAEESERARQRHIDVEHLLLGLMRESKSVAALLEKHGIDRKTVLHQHAGFPRGGETYV
jgi:ATP-dependent Clp protease ATP-binding subunit ClpC